MIFNPEKYRIPDEPEKPFIDVQEITEFLLNASDDKSQVREVISKSLEKNRLSLTETAILLNARDPDLIEEIREGARKLKESVYGNRIVLFAPLYVGNKCSNNCLYCGFRMSNSAVPRLTLTQEQLTEEVKALEDAGQKRLILVFGEHPEYSAEFIADTIQTVYRVRSGNGEIRRVNINASPLGINGFRTVKKAGPGTYQIFQETYHPEQYKLYHPEGRKSNYDYRLTSLDRAQAAGLDDIGIGALFGLYDWKFEVMGLVRHASHLEACFGTGPHTISFPRLQQASSVLHGTDYLVDDEDFMRLVAILRLAVPYTGLILTARESSAVRTAVMQYGVSQIDGGTKIELGGYSGLQSNYQDIDREQFRINDERSLAEIIDELLSNDYLPSFCTACYRLNRTGEHFMEFSVPGFIKRFCTPNAMLTLAEYLEDYAPADKVSKGWQIIQYNLEKLNGTADVPEIKNRLERIRKGERDLYF